MLPLRRTEAAGLKKKGTTSEFDPASSYLIYYTHWTTRRDTEDRRLPHGSRELLELLLCLLTWA